MNGKMKLKQILRVSYTECLNQSLNSKNILQRRLLNYEIFYSDFEREITNCLLKSGDGGEYLVKIENVIYVI